MKPKLCVAVREMLAQYEISANPSLPDDSYASDTAEWPLGQRRQVSWS